MNIHDSNIELLTCATLAFMLKNSIPLNEGFEELISSMVMDGIGIYYTEMDEDFNMFTDELADDAIVYAFSRVQEHHNMVQATVQMMTGGGLN